MKYYIISANKKQYAEILEHITTIEKDISILNSYDDYKDTDSFLKSLSKVSDADIVYIGDYSRTNLRCCLERAYVTKEAKIIFYNKE